MARRIVLHIDKHVHINDVTFEVYRSTEADIANKGKLIATIFEPSAFKTTHRAEAEQLVRDTETPYAFHVSRHFDEDPFPEVFVGDAEVLPRDILLFSDEKMIEIHNGDLGLADGRNVYMSYNYQAIDFKDDYGAQSGVSYIGPPATGLRVPIRVQIYYNYETRMIEIHYLNDPLPTLYFYRIRAKDSDGNYSPYSVTKSIELAPNPAEVFFRIERSKDRVTWEPVSFSNMIDWYDYPYIIDPPTNVQNLLITPLSSKEAKIEFDNPWFYWQEYNRSSYWYRIRTEDIKGEYTEWLEIEPCIIRVRPKEILIRRKEDNGSPSSKDDIDAIDVFRLNEGNVDVNSPVITLLDDQLSDALKYGYTIFYTDEFDMEAEPLYAISDHTPWKNVILFPGQTREDNILSDNFETYFELADRIIEIGTDAGG